MAPGHPRGLGADVGYKGLFMDGVAIGGRKSVMRCIVETMGVPSIHGNPYHPWMVDIHKWNATYTIARCIQFVTRVKRVG